MAEHFTGPHFCRACRTVVQVRARVTYVRTGPDDPPHASERFTLGSCTQCLSPIVLRELADEVSWPDNVRT